MRNYEAVGQWAATLSAEKAYEEITKLKLKYPWLKCDESLAFIEKMNRDIPKITNIVKAQEKLNDCYRKTIDQQGKVIELNFMADDAIISALAERYHSMQL